MMQFFRLIFLGICLVGCGSPLLDHRVKAKPQGGAASSPKKSSSVQLSRVETIPASCSERFENSDLCVELEFNEAPSFQAAFRSFSADLRIWDERKGVWFEEATIPSVFHKSSLECCVPPPIQVTLIAPGRYRLSQIEFHSDGIFDFLVELKLDDSSEKVLRSVLNVEVSQ